MIQSKQLSVAMATLLSVLLLTSCAPKEAPAPKEPQAQQKAEDFDWVIYVKDTQNFAIGPMNIAIAVDMKAVNTSGGIEGKYTGAATATVQNRMSASGGKVSADSVSRSKPFTFNVEQDVPLAPLVPPAEDDDIKPVPLVPPSDEANEWNAQGSITMVTGDFSGTVEAGGASATGNVKGSTSTLPFTMAISGTQVTMKIQIPEVGMGTFKGYIRGEGKKGAEDGLEGFEPVPLTPPAKKSPSKKADDDFAPVPLVPPASDLDDFAPVPLVPGNNS